MGGLGRYPIAAVLLALAVACGENTQVHITPDDPLVPKNGGADIPPAALAVLKECDQGLRAGDNEALARSMDNVARQADPETAAIGKGCAGIANINAGQVSKGLAYIRAAQETDPTPPSVEWTSLMIKAQVVGYTVEDNAAEVQRALYMLAQVDQGEADKSAEMCEALKRAGSRLTCKPSQRPEPSRGGSPEVTTAPPPSSPSGEPTPGTSSPEKPPEKPSEKPSEKLPEPEPSPPERSSPVEPRPEPPPPVPEQS
ncbi:hypothetical protein ACSDR0_28980 [Streptosporangium sp. G11]|uniref:hypothetical protein n=1 Tax=Streptosporangium sp. G11 TaxID=3436926 RepID=UPI003EBEE19A